MVMAQEAWQQRGDAFAKCTSLALISPDCEDPRMHEGIIYQR